MQQRLAALAVSDGPRAHFDFGNALSPMSAEQRKSVAWRISRRLEDFEGDRASLWSKTLLPIVLHSWPRDSRNSRASVWLARAALHAGESLPEVASGLSGILQHLGAFGARTLVGALSKLDQSYVRREKAEALLMLLGQLTDTATAHPPHGLGKLLERLGHEIQSQASLRVTAALKEFAERE